MNLPFLSKKIKWYMAEWNETELKKGFFRPDQKFRMDNARRSNMVVDKLNVTIQGNHILKDVSVEIPDRKITCIIGPSGCGKSTLLKSLNRLLDTNEDFCPNVPVRCRCQYMTTLPMDAVFMVCATGKS